MKISRMITLRRLAAGDDTEELLPEDGGGLGVKFRLHQCCCGSKKRLLIILLVSLLVVGAVATLTYFLTKSKFNSKHIVVKCLFMHQILVRFHAHVPSAYLLKRGFIPTVPRANGPSSCFDSPVVTSSSSPSKEYCMWRLLNLGTATHVNRFR